MENNNREEKMDFKNIDASKTLTIAEGAAISQKLSEILRATTENQKVIGESGILFYIADETEPIAIMGQDVIRLGRADGASDVVTLDLHQYQGAALGVSRYHAEIVYKEGAYFIKDMGSTNGTWINNEKIAPYRLNPLRDADQLRLGHFSLLVRFGN